MMKPITGQYECLHQSGVGMDYFTSRIDKLTLHTNGRFILIVQKQSRAINAAQSLLKNQQGTTTETDTRLEGSYTQQGTQIAMQFDNGGFEQAQFAEDGTGLQVGPNHFNKVSDSTVLPPTQRIKQDMDDIAKGIKIASTLGGIAMKTAKTIQGTIQAVQGTTNPQPPQAATNSQNPQQQQNQQPQPAQTNTAPYGQQTQQGKQPENKNQGKQIAIFCDQCGARSQPGKKFCNQCGAHLQV